MFLSNSDLHKLVDKNIITVSNKKQIKDVAIDVTLYKDIYIETNKYHTEYKQLETIIPGKNKPKVRYVDLSISNEYKITPHTFLIGGINEIINMPNNLIGFLFLKSSVARAGLQHSLAIPIKPGWSGQLVLELTNCFSYHSVLLTNNMTIGQVMFATLTNELDAKASEYLGQYQNQHMLF